MHLVLLDDDPLILDLLEASMARSRPEWVVSRFQNPTLALEAITKSPPDLLLLDANMPEMSGEAVLAQLGTSAPPTIMLSGNNASEIQYLKDFSCILGSLKKPFLPREIAPQIEALLHACTPP